MAVYRNTLDELIEQTCRNALDDWVEGTATGGTSSTVVDTSRVEADDYWNDQRAYCYIRTGTYKGSDELVTDFVNSTTTLSISPTLGGAVVAGDTYVLMTEYRWAEVKAAINAAISSVAQEAYIWRVNDSFIQVQSDVYEYVMPTGFSYIYQITQSDANGLFSNTAEVIPVDCYGIIHTDVPRLKFHQLDPDMDGHYYGQLWQPTDGRYLRIEGVGRQEKLDLDTSPCYLNPNYIMYQAGALLHAKRTRRAENDPDEHGTQARICQSRADLERQRTIYFRLPPDSKRVE